MNNMGYLFAAYTFIWAMVFGYVYIIARRQQTLDREIQTLREALERETGKRD